MWKLVIVLCVLPFASASDSVWFHRAFKEVTSDDVKVSEKMAHEQINYMFSRINSSIASSEEYRNLYEIDRTAAWNCTQNLIDNVITAAMKSKNATNKLADNNHTVDKSECYDIAENSFCNFFAVYLMNCVHQMYNQLRVYLDEHDRLVNSTKSKLANIEVSVSECTTNRYHDHQRYDCNHYRTRDIILEGSFENLIKLEWIVKKMKSARPQDAVKKCIAYSYDVIESVHYDTLENSIECIKEQIDDLTSQFANIKLQTESDIQLTKTVVIDDTMPEEKEIFLTIAHQQMNHMHSKLNSSKATFKNLKDQHYKNIDEQSSFELEFFSNFVSAQSKARRLIEKLANNSHTTISKRKCHVIVNSLHNNTKIFLKNLWNCVEEKQSLLNRYNNRYNEIVNFVELRLAEFEGDYLTCEGNVNYWDQFSRHIVCYKEFAAKTIQEEIATNFVRLNQLFENANSARLKEPLEHCKKINNYDVIEKEYLNIVKKSKKCIKHLINAETSESPNMQPQTEKST